MNVEISKGELRTCALWRSEGALSFGELLANGRITLWLFNIAMENHHF